MSAVETRVRELATRLDLSPDAEAGANHLLRLWAEDDLASTTVRDPLEAVDQHIADAWIAFELDVVREARRGADLGTGAGIPALPLLVGSPDLTMHLVESVGRRTVFLERALAECGLSDRGRVVVARAEGWPEGIGQHDLVTSRALATLDVVLEYCAPLLEVGGHAVAWKGALSAEELSGGERAASVLGLEITEIRQVVPFTGARERRLVVARKISETPDRFPRREGMAKKRPLGAGT